MGRNSSPLPAGQSCRKGLVDVMLRRIEMEIFSRGKIVDAILGRWAVLGRGQVGVK